MLGPSSGKTRKGKSPLAPKGGLHPRGSNYAASTGTSQAISERKKLRFALAKERKASTTLGIIMSAFTVCWLPFFVLALIRPFLEPNAIPAGVTSLFLWLGFANSLLNPIIYATLNRDFRKPFQQILYFRCGSLNHMMREEFYQSQYGDPDHHYCAVRDDASLCGGLGTTTLGVSIPDTDPGGTEQEDQPLATSPRHLAPEAAVIVANADESFL